MILWKLRAADVVILSSTFAGQIFIVDGAPGSVNWVTMKTCELPPKLDRQGRMHATREGTTEKDGAAQERCDSAVRVHWVSQAEIPLARPTRSAAGPAGALETQTPTRQLSITTPDIKRFQCHTNQNAPHSGQAGSSARVQPAPALGSAGLVDDACKDQACSRRRGLAAVRLGGRVGIDAPPRGPGHPESHLEHAVHADARHKHGAKGCRQVRGPAGVGVRDPMPAIPPPTPRGARLFRLGSGMPPCRLRRAQQTDSPGHACGFRSHPPPTGHTRRAPTSCAHGPDCRKQAWRVWDRLLRTGHAGFTCVRRGGPAPAQPHPVRVWPAPAPCWDPHPPCFGACSVLNRRR